MLSRGFFWGILPQFVRNTVMKRVTTASQNTKIFAIMISCCCSIQKAKIDGILFRNMDLRD